MENTTEKQHFPWGWVAAGCGVVSICMLSLAVGSVILFLKLPAVRTTIANLTSSVNTLPPPLPGSTAVPNSGSGNGTSVDGLPFKFSAIQDPTELPNQSLMDQMISSLNLNADTDFMAPKTYKGTAVLDPSTGFIVGNGWCAKDAATLRQNLANMQYQLSINGTLIDLSQYPTLYFTDNQSHTCAMSGLLITPNGSLSGSYHMILTQKFANKLDDGITSSPYPAGDVTFDFNIQFQSAPNSNTNSS